MVITNKILKVVYLWHMRHIIDSELCDISLDVSKRESPLSENIGPTILFR